MTRSFQFLNIVEVQYAGAKRVAPEYWQLEQYRLSGAYGAAGVPTSIQRLDGVILPDLTGLGQSDGEELALGAVNGAIADAVAEGLRYGQPVLMTGATCCNVTGPLGGLQDVMGAGARIGLVWFDAHGDFNTPQTTISGSMGGMPLACCAGLCWPAWREGSHMAAPVPIDRIVHWDGRDLDPKEDQLMAMAGVQRAMSVTGDAADGMAKLIARLAENVEAVFLHVDADILDASLVPGHWTPAVNGPDLAKVSEAFEIVFATGKVAVFSVVSVFPSATPEASAQAIASGCGLVGRGLKAWAKHGRAGA